MPLTLPKAEATQQAVTKVDLTMLGKAREATTEQRQHDKHLDATTHTRTAADITAPTDNGIQAEARELSAEQRLHDEHRQEMIHQQATEAISQG